MKLKIQTGKDRVKRTQHNYHQLERDGFDTRVNANSKKEDNDQESKASSKASVDNSQYPYSQILF